MREGAMTDLIHGGQKFGCSILLTPLNKMVIGTVGHDLIDVGDAIRSSPIGSKRGHLNLFEAGAITMGCDPLQKFQRGIRAFHSETHRTAG